MRIKNGSPKSCKGFTLTEIMIVLIILGLLIAIALPRVSQVLFTGKVSATKASLNSFVKAAKNFNADTNVWPGSVKDLMAPITVGEQCYNTKALNPSVYSAAQAKNWKGPYMDGTTAEVSVDAWGARISIGVVEGSTFKYSGRDANGNQVEVGNAKDSDSFNELGEVSGLYFHSRGEDSSTSGGSETGSAKDDIFVFVASRIK